MKVRELIKELEKCNPDWEIVQHIYDYKYSSISGIGVGKITGNSDRCTFQFDDESDCYESEWNAIEFHL